ncbi:MAG: hypothetical protein ABIP41_04455 [Croceibacterium sp.]
MRLLKTLAALLMSALSLLADCQADHNPRADSKPPAIPSGPCDIQNLPKLSDEIAVANHETMTYLGDAKTKSTKFRLYSYVFNNPESGHGNHRLVVFDANCKFLGLYVTSVADPLRIEGNKVIYETEYPGNVVTFAGDKPPDHIWIDGEIPDFDPPDRERR